MTKDRTEYQRNYKRKKRKAKKIAAANGDIKAQEQIEKEKEKNRLYMREYRKNVLIKKNYLRKLRILLKK